MTKKCFCGNDSHLLFMGEPICKECWEAKDYPFEDDEKTERQMRGERTDRFLYRGPDER